MKLQVVKNLNLVSWKFLFFGSRGGGIGQIVNCSGPDQFPLPVQYLLATWSEILRKLQSFCAVEPFAVGGGWGNGDGGSKNGRVASKWCRIDLETVPFDLK